MFWRGVQALGLQAQCSSIRSTNTSVLALEGNNRFFVQKMILAEAKKAILEDNAEVISLGCAGMVGLADQMSDELGVPVIDSVVAGVKVAEALVGCGLTTSKQRAYLAPEKKELIGMPSYFSNPSNRQ
jgi:allantoin racemase